MGIGLANLVTNNHQNNYRMSAFLMELEELIPHVVNSITIKNWEYLKTKRYGMDHSNFGYRLRKRKLKTALK